MGVLNDILTANFNPNIAVLGHQNPGISGFVKGLGFRDFGIPDHMGYHHISISVYQASSEVKRVVDHEIHTHA